MNAPPDTQAAAAASAVAPAAPQIQVAAQASVWAQAQRLAPGWLSEGEQVRLAAMQRPARRQEFVACRYALRSLLAQATVTPVEHWRLDAAEGKAPALNVHHHGADAAASMYLSLSHSDMFIACALATQPVGVDIEVQSIRSSWRDVLAPAALACSDREMQQLHAIDCERSRQRLFVQWWSLKEAYFKCLGTGVDFSVIQRIEFCRATVSSAPPLAHAQSWSGETLDGYDVVLSACTLERGTQPCALLGDADIKWHGDSDWVLMPC
ncbi:4'-phosphopantetheinyl transferase superfamily protein [Acidovorax sp. 69]|uniref:4'-phosphopantetheinyl transferase family protein n=1 Tax=Acidovorax sp. 69 TaxID=2035202 RepID=UPI000C23F649|nr:4'-phosphopantetheinyl transferase superfamily protein [Acidovorax sp. 69]PJI98634.1 4'-phosphopantetheinyl transferase superfamily protein [Acidovorax sp. 69]